MAENMYWRDVHADFSGANQAMANAIHGFSAVSDVFTRISGQLQQKAAHEQEMAFKQKQLDEQMREYDQSFVENKRQFGLNYGLNSAHLFGVGKYGSNEPDSGIADYSNYDDPRAAPWETDFQGAGAQHNIPPGLLKKWAQTESNFDPTATSRAGAKGLMQFMPSTAKQYGIDPTNPSHSIWAGARHIATLRDKYGNYRDAAIGYNWGEGNLQNWIKRGRNEEELPDETRSYVRKLGLGGSPTLRERIEYERNNNANILANQRLVEWERKELLDRQKQLETWLSKNDSDSSSGSSSGKSGTAFSPEQGEAFRALFNQYRNEGLGTEDAIKRTRDDAVMTGFLTPTQADHAMKGLEDVAKEDREQLKAKQDTYTSGLAKIATSDGAKEFIDVKEADDALRDVKMAVRSHPEFKNLSEDKQAAVAGAYIKSLKESGQLPEEGWFLSDPKDRMETGWANNYETLFAGKTSWTNMLKRFSEFKGNKKDLEKNPAFGIFMGHLQEAGILEKTNLGDGLKADIVKEELESRRISKERDDKVYAKGIRKTKDEIDRRIKTQDSMKKDLLGPLEDEVQAIQEDIETNRQQIDKHSGDYGEGMSPYSNVEEGIKQRNDEWLEKKLDEQYKLQVRLQKAKRKLEAARKEYGY